MTTLDCIPKDYMMSVYCRCGKIVTLAKDEMKLKLSLGKELECMTCRNLRISEEIEEINNHYLGVVEEDPYFL
jgi:hypothetical protein